MNERDFMRTGVLPSAFTDQKSFEYAKILSASTSNPFQHAFACLCAAAIKKKSRLSGQK
jgi:hypothetical protein